MRVLVVDDDVFVTMSLKTILESDENIEVVATGNNGEQAIELYKQYEPDVLLMDIRMDVMNGLEAAENIFKTYKNANVLFLTTFSDDEYIVKALNIGARGYLLKQDFESIIPAIKAAYSGQSVFGGQVVSKLPSLMNKSGDMDKEGQNLALFAYSLTFFHPTKDEVMEFRVLPENIGIWSELKEWK